MGPTNPNRAKEEAPRSIRAQFGTDNMINAIYGAENTEVAQKYIKWIFEDNEILSLPIENVDTSSLSPQKTIMIIKPGVADKTDEIVQKLVWRGFQIHKRSALFSVVGSV